MATKIPTKDEIIKKTGLCIREEYDAFNINLPNSTAVYVIYIKSGEKYIGQSSNVRKRLTHHISGPKFDEDYISKIHIYGTYKLCLDYLEAWLICNTKPELNKIFPCSRLSEFRNKFLCDKIKRQISKRLCDDAILSISDYIIEKNRIEKSIIISEKLYITNIYDDDVTFTTINSIRKFGELIENIYELEKQRQQSDIIDSWGIEDNNERPIERNIYEHKIFQEIVKRTLKKNPGIVTKKAPNNIQTYTIRYINNNNCLLMKNYIHKMTLDRCLKCEFHMDGDCGWYEYKTIIIRGREKYIVPCAHCGNEIFFLSLVQLEGEKCKKCGLYHMYLSKGLFAIQIKNFNGYDKNV